MAIQTSNIATPARTDATTTAATAATPPTAAELQAKGKSELNTQILQASLTVSISAGNESQQLVLRSVIDKLNEMLDDGSGVPALDTAAKQDNTPDGTAGRIVSMSTAFFGSYAKQHPELSEADAAASFVELIRGGVEQGFKEARGILDGLGALQGDVAGNIDKTFELVSKGFDDFLAKYQVKAPVDGSQATAEEKATS
jgi:hypothetical protein